MVLHVLIFFLIAQLVHGDDCDSEYSCASCSEVRICRNTTSGFEELFRFSCPSTAPYCDSSAVCSLLPSLGCGPTDNFTCMRDGTFPNFLDCSKYRVCRNGTSYAFTCPGGSYYNSDQEGCVHGATCYAGTCNGKSGMKVPYEHDAGIYVYCQDGNPLFIDRCPGTYKLNAITQTCGPVCQAVGNKIPDVDDCTKFFYCSKEPYASTFTVTSVQCPELYGFDPRGLRCVPLKMLPGCLPQQTI